MGYYTTFTLKESSNPTFREVLVMNIGCQPFDDSMKWYDHDDDIKAAMLSTGTERVVIHGEGEQQGDVWDKEYTIVDLVGRRVDVRTFKYRLVRDDQ